MLQRHPRKFSEDECVFLWARITTRDPRMARAELRDWVKHNAKDALLNEPASGYPRVFNYLLRTVVVFAAAPKARRGNQIFGTLANVWVSSRRLQSFRNGELVLLNRVDVERRMGEIINVH
eukprot:3789985-Karenia_brevis.AAC.1